MHTVYSEVLKCEKNILCFPGASIVENANCVKNGYIGRQVSKCDEKKFNRIRKTQQKHPDLNNIFKMDHYCPAKGIFVGQQVMLNTLLNEQLFQNLQPSSNSEIQPIKDAKITSVNSKAIHKFSYENLESMTNRKVELKDEITEITGKNETCSKISQSKHDGNTLDDIIPFHMNANMDEQIAKKNCKADEDCNKLNGIHFSETQCLPQQPNVLYDNLQDLQMKYGAIVTENQQLQRKLCMLEDDLVAVRGHFDSFRKTAAANLSYQQTIHQNNLKLIEKNYKSLIEENDQLGIRLEKALTEQNAVQKESEMFRNCPPKRLSSKQELPHVNLTEFAKKYTDLLTENKQLRYKIGKSEERRNSIQEDFNIFRNSAAQSLSHQHKLLQDRFKEFQTKYSLVISENDQLRFDLEKSNDDLIFLQKKYETFRNSAIQGLTYQQNLLHEKNILLQDNSVTSKMNIERLCNVNAEIESRNICLQRQLNKQQEIFNRKWDKLQVDFALKLNAVIKDQDKRKNDMVKSYTVHSLFANDIFQKKDQIKTSYQQEDLKSMSTQHFQIRTYNNQKILLENKNDSFEPRLMKSEQIKLISVQQEDAKKEEQLNGGESKYKCPPINDKILNHDLMLSCLQNKTLVLRETQNTQRKALFDTEEFHPQKLSAEQFSHE